MDSDLYLEDFDPTSFWYEPTLLPLIQTSFRPYSRPTQIFSSSSSSSSEHPKQNIHKRMINYLRTIPPPTKTNPILEPPEFEKERSYRHMINERQRRKKERDTYTALHSMLPLGTKLGKNSTLQVAGSHLRELERVKEGLRKRNWELENNVCQGERVKLRRQNPVSGIDSMIGALKCIKSMGLKATRIRSEFSVAEFLAVMEVKPKIEGGQVREALETALDEVDRKVLLDFRSREWHASHQSIRILNS